ncbi:MAG TPA: hypothetical protein VKN36_16350 [Eudoraea sp.]|jgi:hypothetical protein|nr:hypothetical protein [Eudoraea sp.]
MIELGVAESEQAEVEDVYPFLRDSTDYINWRHLPVKAVAGVASYFEFSPLPSGTMGLREIYSLENEVVQCKYIKGPFMGIGQGK